MIDLTDQSIIYNSSYDLSSNAAEDAELSSIICRKKSLLRRFNEITQHLDTLADHLNDMNDTYLPQEPQSVEIKSLLERLTKLQSVCDKRFTYFENEVNCWLHNVTNPSNPVTSMNCKHLKALCKSVIKLNTKIMCVFNDVHSFLNREDESEDKENLPLQVNP